MSFEQKINLLEANDDFIERVLRGFTRKKKKKSMSVLPENLLEYFLDGYVRKIQWFTTKKAGQVISLRRQHEKEKNRKRIDLLLLGQFPLFGIV